MAKNGIESYVNQEVTVLLRDQRTEEVSGVIKAVVDGGYLIAYDQRGSGYTHFLPNTIPLYVKGVAGTVAKFAKGDQITAEINIDRVIKRKGVVDSTDESGFTLEYESHMRVVKHWYPYSKIESLFTATYTKEGEAAAKERSARMAGRVIGGRPAATAKKPIARASAASGARAPLRKAA